MFENLYDNIGEKIKRLAKWTFVSEAIVAVIAGVFMLFQGDDGFFWGLLLIFCGPVVAWVSSWLLYAFGDIVENISTIRNKYVGEAPKAFTGTAPLASSAATQPKKQTSATAHPGENTVSAENTRCEASADTEIEEASESDPFDGESDVFQVLKKECRKFKEDHINVKKGALKKYYGNQKFVTIPEDITSIGNDAFEFCESLFGIIIDKNVTGIGSYAFNRCIKLRAVILGEGVSQLKAGVFSGCRNLSDIIIPASVIKIDDSTFEGCKNLTVHTTKGSYAESYARNNGINVVLI